MGFTLRYLDKNSVRKSLIRATSFIRDQVSLLYLYSTVLYCSTSSRAGGSTVERFCELPVRVQYSYHIWRMSDGEGGPILVVCRAYALPIICWVSYRAVVIAVPFILYLRVVRFCSSNKP